MFHSLGWPLLIGVTPTRKLSFLKILSSHGTVSGTLHLEVFNPVCMQACIYCNKRKEMVVHIMNRFFHTIPVPHWRNAMIVGFSIFQNWSTAQVTSGANLTKLSAAKEFRLRSFTWERQLMALSPTTISAQGRADAPNKNGWHHLFLETIQGASWGMVAPCQRIPGTLHFFWQNWMPYIYLRLVPSNQMNPRFSGDIWGRFHIQFPFFDKYFSTQVAATQNHCHFPGFFPWVLNELSGTVSSWTSAVPRMHGWMSAGRWPRPLRAVQRWKGFDGWNPANQLRLVVYPIIYKGYIPGGPGFLNHQQ